MTDDRDGELGVRQRIAAELLWRALQLVQRLPDGPVHRVAHVAGAGLYLAQHRRRALVRANLARICAWLVAEGRATPRQAAAVRDARAMDRLVRDAFGHYVRAYAEAALVPGYDRERLRRRVRLETPHLVAQALAPRDAAARGRLVVGLHFGAVELAARYAVAHGSPPVSGPMETIADPVLQRTLLRARSGSGVRIIPLGSAASDLMGVLARGEIAAIVGDRAIRRSGARTTLFGAPIGLPAGPAILAHDSGARVYAVAVRRVGWGRYAARMATIELPAEGTRRECVRHFLDAEARVFESFIGDAPEQWWTIFFPIWAPDADGAAA